LTCLHGSDGEEGILTGFEGSNGDILNVDPRTGGAVTELDTRAFLTRKWGLPPTQEDIIAGYNNIPYVKSSQNTVRLFGLLTQSPHANEKTSAWILSRTTGMLPQYELHEVKALKFPADLHRSNDKLVSVRALVVSPFPEDQGQVLYLGGYGDLEQAVQNTAWAYRVGINTALRRYSAPNSSSGSGP